MSGDEPSVRNRIAEVEASRDGEPCQTEACWRRASLALLSECAAILTERPDPPKGLQQILHRLNAAAGILRATVLLFSPGVRN